MGRAGFLPKRQLRRNLRILINILELYENQKGKKLAIIFLDAQKAFDNINWNFMLNQIENMETGPDFMSWIRAIYKYQTTRTDSMGT